MLLNYIKWQHQASGSLGAEKLHRRGESKESGLGSGLMSAMLLKDRKNPVQSFFALPSATSGTQKVKVSVTQSCPTLCDPMDCSPSGSSVCGILQARILKWVAIPFIQGIFPTQGSNLHLLCRVHWQASSGKATHSSVLAWRISQIEELGGLQSMGLQRLGHD